MPKKWVATNWKGFICAVIILVVIYLAQVVLAIFHPYVVQDRLVYVERKLRAAQEKLNLQTIPGGYELEGYGESRKGYNAIAFLTKVDTDQKLIVASLREHRMSDLDSISFSREAIVYPYMWTGTLVGSWVDFTYIMPTIRKDSLRGMGNECILRGLWKHTKPKRLQSEYADIYYIEAEFRRIGFYKEKDWIWNFPTPVLDFRTFKKGALAFLKNKADGKVVICVSVEGNEGFAPEEFNFFLVNYDPRVLG